MKHVQTAEEQINASTIGDQVKNVPVEIWLNRFQCADYNAYIEQNGSDFGYIQKTNL